MLPLRKMNKPLLLAHEYVVELVPMRAGGGWLFASHQRSSDCQESGGLLVATLWDGAAEDGGAGGTTGLVCAERIAANSSLSQFGARSARLRGEVAQAARASSRMRATTLPKFAIGSSLGRQFA